MMNIISMMRKNALKKDGWKNKIKSLEKNMIKMKEKESWILQTELIIATPEY